MTRAISTIFRNYTEIKAEWGNDCQYENIYGYLGREEMCSLS